MKCGLRYEYDELLDARIKSNIEKLISPPLEFEMIKLSRLYAVSRLTG